MDGGFRDGGLMHVLIVGGGASGVLMAAHLLRLPAAIKVTIIERAAMLGCGIAYGTDDPDHLLNTRVSQMSALADQPDHFQRWLGTENIAAASTSFVSRGTYGRYLASLLAPWRDGAGRGQLRCVRGECLRLKDSQAGVTAILADGRRIQADRAILATGHAVPTAARAPLQGGWDFRPPADKMAAIAIIGTGLSMVDHVATLLAAGHRGQIHCLSRRGLIPQPHDRSHPQALQPKDIPFGQPVSALMRWLRSRARRAEAQGGTWRDAVDAIRPHVAAIWRAWPLTEKARFLRHAAAWWEVHRHRMPPVSAARIAKAIECGQLQILRGRFEDAKALSGGQIALTIIPRAKADPVTLRVDRVIDCRGIRRDPAEHAAPVIRDLLACGTARLDPLGLGLDTTCAAQVIDRSGAISACLYAIGPAARGALWEITAIPDIREQAAALARSFAGGQVAIQHDPSLPG